MTTICNRCYGHDHEGKPRDGTIVAVVSSDLDDMRLSTIHVCRFCADEARVEIERRKEGQVGRMRIVELS